MRKFMTAATLALTVSVAGAQAGGGYADNTQYVAPATTATAQPVTGSVVLTDIPAGHWAREAVQTVVEAGLIQGFPDGTFRGNENLTRYQAAMIFSRLLQSGALSSADISDEDLLVITRGMQEVSTELAAISSRLTAVERLTVEQQAQIDALQAAIADVSGADTTALEARIAALEGTAPVTMTPTTPMTDPAPVIEVPVTNTPDTIVIETPDVVVPMMTSSMYAGIGAGYNAENSKYNGTFQVKNTAGNVTYDPRCIDVVDYAKSAFSKNKPAEYKRADYCGSVLGTVGANNVVGPVGARVNVEYIPVRDNAIAADVNATANFDLGMVQPYAGAGVGVVYGTTVTGGKDRKTDIYGNLLGGLDFKVTPNVGLFVEGNGKYYFSNNTTVAQTLGTGVIKADEKGFGYGARGGVKFFF